VIGPPQASTWGCDSPGGSRTSILKHDRVVLLGGPFPCFTQFPTIAKLLDQAGILTEDTRQIA